LLNHAEDQTIAAVAAVLNAIDTEHLRGLAFTDWAVVAATCFQGRVPLAASFDKFRRQGPLSVSPLIVPFMSLHSTSSMISLALRIHGPSVGVGGGNGEFVQALTTGLAMLQERTVPGVWVVATGWDPEMLLQPDEDAPPPVCWAAALALVAETASAYASSLRLVPDAHSRNDASVPRLTDLVQFLRGVATAGRARRWSCPLDGNYRLELTLHDMTPLAKSA
jgi:hypothetical protein